MFTITTLKAQPKVWRMTVFLTTVLILSYNPIYAQDEGKDSKRVKSESRRQNLQQYTPSILLNKGQWEVKAFQNFYTQTARFGKDFKTVKSQSRTSYFTSIEQFYYGINSKFNVGFDVWLKGVNVSEESTSLSELFGSTSSVSRFSPLYVGPKAKFVISSLRTSYEITLLIPIGEDFEGRDFTDDRRDLFLEPDRTLIIGSAYLDRSFTDKFQLFVRFSQWLSLPRNSFKDDIYLETPLAAFLSYFPNNRWSIYLMNEWWVKHLDGPFNSFFMQTGPGVKFQIIPGHFEIEGLYTRFLLGSEFEGVGNTINFGVRLLR